MITKGQTLVNPVTGERMTFLETSAETDGEYVRIELHAEPQAFVAAAHVHPAQVETFEVVSGTLGAKVAGKGIEAQARDVLVVEPGQAHKWWNAGEGNLVFRCELRPALRFESLIETMFALAAAGKTNKKGLPNPFRLAVIARAHFDTVRLPFPPAPLQRGTSRRWSARLAPRIQADLHAGTAP
jgi:mannose-6-phosphate isomerase-like protein (cupin superfamily)